MRVLFLMCFSIFDLKKNIVHTFVGQNMWIKDHFINQMNIMNPKFLSIHWSMHFIGFIRFHWQVTGVHGMPGPDGHLFMRQGSDVCRALWLLRKRQLHVQQNGLFESRFVKRRNGTSPNLGGSNPNSNSRTRTPLCFSFSKLWPTKKWALDKPFEISESEKGIPTRQLWTQVLLSTHFLQPMVYIKLSTFSGHWILIPRRFLETTKTVTRCTA